MQMFAIKATVTAVWVSVICAAGIVIDSQSVPVWIALTGAAIVPPLIMLWRWHVPPPSMSEIIQDSLR